MSDFRAKFDSELRDIHTSWLDLRAGNADRSYPHHSEALIDAPLSLLLQFEGDIIGIEDRGFSPVWVEGQFARGDVELSDLEAVATHAGVVRLEYGQSYKSMLDTSVKEINVRDQIWSVNTTTGAFTGPRGSGVLIGVIDTGIDFNNEVFMAAGSKNTTRIIRIWDMGIAPHDGIGSPDVALIKNGFTYGVEYSNAHIDAVLQKKAGAKPVKHRDCVGHGTHVASIAAGDGRVPRGKKKFVFVGVAPAAELIVVKMLFLQEHPQQNGRPLSDDRRMEDAISYIERVAQNQLNDRPVAINVSLGSEYGPHDGLSAFEQSLANHFSTATKRALIVAAGNEADSRQHGVITVPASGTIGVPFALYDERTVKTDQAFCSRRENAEPELFIEFWYAKLAPQQQLTSTFKPPKKAAAVAGPALGAAAITGTYGRKQPFQITHEADGARNVLRFKVTPLANDFADGPFIVTVTAPGGTVIHAWGKQPAFHGFRIGHDDGRGGMKPLPAGVVDDAASTLSSPGTSAGPITVAAYDDVQGAPSGFSSRGPLVSYGAAPPAAKPDIAAPGQSITAALVPNSVLGDLAKRFNLGSGSYASFPGTSAAAPHVTGVAALLFEKKPALTFAALKQELFAKGRPPKTAGTFGNGKVDGKATRDAI